MKVLDLAALPWCCPTLQEVTTPGGKGVVAGSKIAPDAEGIRRRYFTGHVVLVLKQSYVLNFCPFCGTSLVPDE